MDIYYTQVMLIRQLTNLHVNIEKMNHKKAPVTML